MVPDDEYVVRDGASAAAIVSAGYLPLRPRAEAAGVHHRPAFAGTAVLIGESHYEVVDERVQEEGVVYGLRPWPHDQIMRDRVTYGPALIAAVREERRRLAERERGRKWLWPLYPLVGALPEPEQIRWCDRWGLDAVTATRTSAVLEAALFLTFVGTLPLLTAAKAAGLVWPFLLAAMMRALGAFVTSEIAGSPIVAAALWVASALRPRRTTDLTLLPMTRNAFWARLALPDRQTRQADGSLIVESLLPHLTWTPGARVAGDDMWRVLSTDARISRGRVVYTYRLLTETDKDGRPDPDARPPRATAYQDGVLDDVRREWDDLRVSGFAWLISLLPARVQERALGAAGGPAVLKGATRASAVFTLAAAGWMVVAPGPLNFLTGVALAADALVRLRRSAEARYAPSLLGGLFPRYLRPERVAYHAHRAAEREVLLGSTRRE